VREPNECTNIGHRCWLVSCINLGNGFHHSHTNLCNSSHNLQPCITSSHSSSINSPSIPADLLPVPIATMLCHRMRSRRGGTNDRSSRCPPLPIPNSTSLASSAENPHQHSFAGQYQDTRSGRDRAGLHSSSREAAAVHTTTFPLPLHPTPHTTQFRFCRSLNRLVIIAIISINIIEETEQHAPLDNFTDEANRAGSSSRKRGNNDE